MPQSSVSKSLLLETRKLFHHSGSNIELIERIFSATKAIEQLTPKDH